MQPEPPIKPTGLGLKFLINPLKKIAQFTFVLNGGWY
jgi:hypothetical protein